MKSPSRVVGVGIVAFMAAAALAACSQTPADTGPVEISVVSLIPGSDDAAFAAFDDQVKQFEKANPEIKVTSEEYEWTGPTFAAQLAGGTLPTVYTIPFTDGHTLIANGQLSDITKEVDALGYADKFNPNVLSEVQDEAGSIYGFPTAAYAAALHYNRALFTAAGLDPDKPPTTWDQVRDYAKKITAATGMAGYAQMAASNTGGWQLSDGAASRGGEMQVNKDGKWVMNADNDATVATLEYLHDLRWEDNTMGADFLLDWGTINQAFGAGQIGMYTSGSDIYTNLVQSQNMNPADYGMTTIPTEGDDGGVFAGGTIATVNVKATEAQKAAAVKWIDFYYMQKLLDKDAAVNDAKTLAASDQPVGVPALPIFDQATLDQSQAWIKDYINVPLDQMAGFTSNIYNQKLVGEPARHTQDVYAALDAVVQAVFTDQNADIKALLKQVNTDMQPVIDADQ